MSQSSGSVLHLCLVKRCLQMKFTDWGWAKQMLLACTPAGLWMRDGLRLLLKLELLLWLTAATCSSRSHGRPSARFGKTEVQR